MNADIRIRAARVETDIPGIARVLTACDPANPVSPDTVRSWFTERTPEYRRVLQVAVDGSDAVNGYSVIYPPDEFVPAHHFFVWMGVEPAQRCLGIGSALWEAALVYLRDHAATRIGTVVDDNDPASLAFGRQRGFDIHQHTFHSTLDLTTFDETPYLPVIAALETQGIRFCTLADFPDTLETLEQFYQVNLGTVQDIPGEDWDFSGYRKFFMEYIVGSPNFRRENHFLAVDGDVFAGMASISLNPETGNAYNGTTGVIRAYRGRKIAQAVKVLAALYARQRGARKIDTDNDSLNAPMLAVNRKLGYQIQATPGNYNLVRWLGQVG